MKLNIKKKLHLTGHRGAVYTIVEGQTINTILSGSGDGWVIEWNLDNPKKAKVIAKIDGNIFSLCYLKKKNWLVVGNMNGGVHWIDLNTKQDIRNIMHHERGVFDILEIGEDIFTLGGKGKLTKWNIETQRPTETIRLTFERLRSIDFCKEKNELAIAASDNHIYFLDKDSFELKRRIDNAHNNSVFTVKYHPNGKYLLSGGRDALLKVWDLDNGDKEISNQPAHWYTINTLVFHPKGHLFATGSRDKTVKIWDAETFQLLKVIDAMKNGGHINSVNKVFWSNHSDLLISCSDDKTLMGWGVKVVELLSC